MKILSLFKNPYFYLLIILFLAFYVRVYKIDSPIADWHSWRQADTAAVTRNFIKEGFNPLLPKYDDMSGVAEIDPIVNANRFRFVEFPIYNIVVYPLYLIFGINEVYHRLVSIIFSLGSIVFVFLISKRYLGVFSGLLSALVFALLPFNVFFSRSILPEPTFVFFSLGMLYFLDRYIYENNLWLMILGFTFTSLAFLIKPWAVFYLPPIFYSIFQKEKKIKNLSKYFIFFLVALLPFILWRLWILQQPEGIPSSAWLLNSDGIRFRPAFFWWLLAKRIGGEILGVSGAILFFLGVILKPKNYFLHFWLLGIILYFIFFATGNVRHDYYQVIFIPISSIFLAKGFIDLINYPKVFIPRIWTILLAITLLPLTFYFTWREVGGFYQINNYAIVEAGKRADQLLPSNARVLAPYNGDTAFLYQINRPGFPNFAFSIKDMVADYGVTHYVSIAKDSKTTWVLRYFQLLEEKENYVIADLSKVKREFDNNLDPEPK